MIITRNGERFFVTEDHSIDESAPEVALRGKPLATKQRVMYLIKVSSEKGAFHHIAKGSTRSHCLLGLLDQGFLIEREPADPDTQT